MHKTSLGIIPIKPGLISNWDFTDMSRFSHFAIRRTNMTDLNAKLRSSALLLRAAVFDGLTMFLLFLRALDYTFSEIPPRN